MKRRNMLKSKAMKWVKALRSGKYKQGEGLLVQGKRNKKGHKVFEYCCLGVLAEVSGFKKEELLNRGLLRGIEGECGLNTVNGTPIKEGNEEVTIKTKRSISGEVDNLADANDVGVSFKAIATWIEKNYKLL
jgi:hypothetical protein